MASITVIFFTSSEGRAFCQCVQSLDNNRYPLGSARYRSCGVKMKFSSDVISMRRIQASPHGRGGKSGALRNPTFDGEGKSSEKAIFKALLTPQKPLSVNRCAHWGLHFMVYLPLAGINILVRCAIPKGKAWVLPHQCTKR